jgi:hypothetical protein
MILLLLFVLLLFVTVSRLPVPSGAGISDAVGILLPDVLFRLALAGLFTASLLVVRSVVSGRYPDSR